MSTIDIEQYGGFLKDVPLRKAAQFTVKNET
jgi:hypothetical protein